MGHISTDGLDSFSSTSREAGVAAASAQSVTNYRKYSNDYDDAGRYTSVVLPTDVAYVPNFYSRDTGQIWEASNGVEYLISIWVGNTLANRSVHEITINNNGNNSTQVTFAASYLLVDEEEGVGLAKQITTIPAHTTAYYYCTAVYENGDLFLHLRKGSQDTRPVRNMEILTEGDQV